MLIIGKHKLAIGFVAFCVNFFFIFQTFKMLILLFLDSHKLFMNIINYPYVKFWVIYKTRTCIHLQVHVLVIGQIKNPMSITADLLFV